MDEMKGEERRQIRKRIPTTCTDKMEGSGKEREREILGFSTCMFGNSFLFDEFWSHTTPGMYSNLAPSYDGGWGF